MTSKPSPWPPEPHRSASSNLAPELVDALDAAAKAAPPLPDDVVDELREALAPSEQMHGRPRTRTNHP